MMKNLTILCISLAVNGWRSNAQTMTAKGKTYAIVIGISTYKSKALPALQYADKDASMFAYWLQSKAGGSIPSAQIRLLLNEKATIGAIYDALDWLREHCKNEDLGYIYFSGHGDVETKNTFSLGYLLAYNTPPNNYNNNAISIEDLNNKANTLSVKNKAKVILITDACHTGKLAGDFYKGKQLVANQLRLVLNKEVRLTSCGTDEEAAEGSDWGGGRGVFSYYLLMGLNGLADLKKDGTIQLREITKFLDSSFAADKYLISDKHKQHPVTNGNPYFPLAVTDTATLNELYLRQSKEDSAASHISTGLQSLNAIGLQPIDYFFSLSQIQPLESYLDFESYTDVAAEALPLAIINDRILYQQEVDTLIDSLHKARAEYYGNDVANLDSLKMLRNQLQKNKSLVTRFNDQLIELIHEKGQAMINAYLEGDVAELEKRQYYYTGNRQYGDFLSMLKIALRIVPADHSLADLLQVNYSYLSGLIDRMQMATANNADSLLNKAFIHLRMALQLDPYAAYIHNELGNLYLHKKRFDSAAYHFDVATALSPTWSVPWSNKIRLNLAINNLTKAKEAIHKADSLQPDLAYVMMNAGLVMERENNWLAAESFYKKAIVENVVHFFPYEHLGKIYLLTGEYARADSCLFDAELRKDYFGVNNQYFDYGPELGGPPASTGPPWQDPPCGLDSITSPKQSWQPYISLVMVIKEGLTADTTANLKSKLSQQFPAIPLLHHYLGKQLYHEGKLQPSETALLQAVKNYRNKANLWNELKQQLYGANQRRSDTCLLQSILFYQYDVLEDHYLLASLYEKQGLPVKALAQYNIISAIENRRQADQAENKGFLNRLKFLQQNPDAGTVQTLLQEYEIPINMGGAIKAARLHEQMGHYLQAEKILLSQVSLNRLAGDKRQQVLLEKKPGTWQIPGGSDMNFYWLSINRALESETYNFYRRTTEKFPRDFEWKEKAGLFLHNRLALTFSQLQAGEYQNFYDSIGKYAYPFMSGDATPEENMIRFDLPGTGENLQIEAPAYDPLKESLEYLMQSAQLSGEVNSSSKILEAMADLNSWMGNIKEATRLYNELLTSLPANKTTRNKLINYLAQSYRFPEARQLLNRAYQRKQIKSQQIPLLAEYDMLAGSFTVAAEILKSYQPQDAFEKGKKMALYSRIYALAGEHKKALTYLRDSFPPIRMNSEVEVADLDINAQKTELAYFRLYSLARVYALLKNEDKAMDALKTVLDSGFNYKYVLDNDPAWIDLRNTPQWEALIKKYDFSVSYMTQPLKVNRDPNIFRIPNFKQKMYLKLDDPSPGDRWGPYKK